MRRLTAPLLGALLLLPATGAALAGTPRDTIVVAKQIDQFISLDPAEAFEPGVGEVTQNFVRPAGGISQRHRPDDRRRPGRLLVDQR